MKLNIISEVFQKPSMDGVDVRVNKKGNLLDKSYIFSDTVGSETVQYVVTITEFARTKILHWIVEYAPDLELFKLDGKLSKLGGPIADISLESDNSFDLTGFGNQFYVYSKLVSCIHHHVVERNPIALSFSGFTADMDLAYDRLIKMGNKTWPEHKFIPFGPDIYISAPTYELLSSIPGFDNAFALSNDTRNHHLHNAKTNKIASKLMSRDMKSTANFVRSNVGRLVIDAWHGEYIIDRVDGNKTILRSYGDDDRIYVVDTIKIANYLNSKTPFHYRDLREV